MGVDDFMDKKEMYRNEEGYNMCQALQEMMEDSRQEGIAEGIRKAVDLLLEMGLSEETVKAKIVQKYSIPEEKLEAILTGR